MFVQIAFTCTYVALLVSCGFYQFPKPGDKFMTYAQIAGMLLLFTLIIYATGNDIYRLFIK